MGNYNFIVKDYEVFGLKTEPLYERENILYIPEKTYCTYFRKQLSDVYLSL